MGVRAGLLSPGLEVPEVPTANLGDRFGASGMDSSDIEVWRVDGSSEGGCEVVAEGDIDSDIVRVDPCPCPCCGGDVCGVIELEFTSCLTRGTASVEASLE